MDMKQDGLMNVESVPNLGIITLVWKTMEIVLS